MWTEWYKHISSTFYSNDLKVLILIFFFEKKKVFYFLYTFKKEW